MIFGKEFTKKSFKERNNSTYEDNMISEMVPSSAEGKFKLYYSLFYTPFFLFQYISTSIENFSPTAKFDLSSSSATISSSTPVELQLTDLHFRDNISYWMQFSRSPVRCFPFFLFQFQKVNFQYSG